MLPINVKISWKQLQFLWKESDFKNMFSSNVNLAHMFTFFLSKSLFTFCNFRPVFAWGYLWFMSYNILSKHEMKRHNLKRFNLITLQIYFLETFQIWRLLYVIKCYQLSIGFNALIFDKVTHLHRAEWMDLIY